MVKRSRTDESRVTVRKRGRSSKPNTRIPKAIFKGDCQFTRSCNVQLNVTAGLGWNFGANNYSAIACVFDPTAVTIFGSALNFLNNGLPNASEISAFWDSVMIHKVEITVDHVNDPNSVSGVNTSMPRLAICNDYNDGSTGTTLLSVQQHSDCKFFTGRTTKWTVYPKHQRLIYYNAITSSYEPARGYVNADTAIPHYGTHIAMTDPSILLAGRTSFDFKFFFKAKMNK